MPTVRRILFPTDFSACAEGAYRHAIYLADRLGAELHVLHVVERDDAPERAWPDAPGTGHLRITMEDVCRDLGLPEPAPRAPDPSAEIEVVETEVVDRTPVAAVLDYVRDEEIDLVVMGTHGRSGLKRLRVGSVAEAVVRQAPCPVLTVRPMPIKGSADGPWAPARILVALDAPPYHTDVPPVRWGATLAAAFGGRLDLLHVQPPYDPFLSGPNEAAHDRDEATEALAALAAGLRAELPLDMHMDVRTGEAPQVIDAVARATGAHLVVVGTHGRGGLGRALLGSVAEAVVRTAPCPVLVARDALAPGEPQAGRAASEVRS